MFLESILQIMNFNATTRGSFKVVFWKGWCQVACPLKFAFYSLSKVIAVNIFLRFILVLWNFALPTDVLVPN